GTSTSTEQPELDDNIPAPPTEEEIAVMEGRELQPQPGTSVSMEQPELNENIPVHPTKEISEFPTEDRPLILDAEDSKVIRVPFKEGQTLIGELSFNEYTQDNKVSITITGITEADTSELPIIYGLEEDNLFRTSSTMENHFFKYRNEEGTVLPVETVEIVPFNNPGPAVHRVGQKVALRWSEMQQQVDTPGHFSRVYKTVVGKVLSLGDQPDSFVRIGVPKSTTSQQLDEFPLNTFVRIDGEEQGIYKPVLYVYTNEIKPDERIDVNESTQETKIVVGKELSLQLPELSINGIIEHIDTVQGYPIVFLHVPVSPEHVQSVKQQLETVFQDQQYDVPMEWKGQLINAAPVIVRIGDEVIGGKVINTDENVEDGDEHDDEEWIEVTHWRSVSENAEHVKEAIIGFLDQPEQVGSTVEMLLDLFSFNLQAKSLQKLIKKQVVPQQQLEKLHTKIKDIMANTLLPNITNDMLDAFVQNHSIYNYSPYQIDNIDENLTKQLLEVVRELISEQNESLQAQIRYKMDPVVKEVIRDIRDIYEENAHN
ncbi:hypothetical protein, partial [Paenibacillus popilliae]